MRAISRFLVPTYAIFRGGPHIQQFDTSRQLGIIGNQLFVGYYNLVSPEGHFKKVMQQIHKCFHLISQIDTAITLQVEIKPYRQLYDNFQEALISQQWDTAEQILETITSHNLATAENLSFLRIEWLARQERWRDVWNHPHYSLLTALPVPRIIRSAMLTAFHYTQLVVYEQAEQWEDALKIFEQHRPQLGMLLNGRFSLDHIAVLRIFGYLAVSDGNHAMMERVKADTAPNDFQTRFVLSELSKMLPPKQELRPIDKQLQDALSLSDYESAWHLTHQLNDPLLQTAAKLQIGYLSQEPSLAQDALATYDRLYVELQTELKQRYTEAEVWLTEIKGRYKINKPLNIQTWADWFEVAHAKPHDESLVGNLDLLIAQPIEALLTHAQIDALIQRLVDIPNEQYLQRGLHRHAIIGLVGLCLGDKHFPRPIANDLYDYLLQFVIQDSHNEQHSNFVLRLQEAILAADPARCSQAITLFENWFEKPVPALQLIMLEALELVVFYGAEPEKLYLWYRLWAETMVNQPSISTVDLEVWLSFATWIQAGEDLLRKLQSRLEIVSNGHEDHLSNLPAGYQIAIFSFDEGASQRTRDILLQHNSELDIRLCHEKDSNKTVESLATKANMVVLVTVCISHAISYAVKPYAGDRLVQPTSRGASSILKAIESHLQFQPV